MNEVTFWIDAFFGPVDDAIGIAGGVTLIALCWLCCNLYKSFWVTILQDNPRSADLMSHGIFVGFLGVALNTFWWEILNRSAKLFEWVDVLAFMAASGPIAGLIFKFVLGGYAAYCHLKAAWIGLEGAERGQWHWLTVAFYPRKRHLWVRVIGPLTSLQRKR